MEAVGAGFCGHHNLATTVVPVLGIEIAGQDAELGNRVEVGNDAGVLVERFVDVCAVHRGPLAVSLCPLIESPPALRLPETGVDELV